jgi:hypothetical protein
MGQKRIMQRTSIRKYALSIGEALYLGCLFEKHPAAKRVSRKVSQ